MITRSSTRLERAAEGSPAASSKLALTTVVCHCALCPVLWDPSGIIADLKRMTMPYPAALKTALIRQFFWEAHFSRQVAAKAMTRADVS